MKTSAPSSEARLAAQLAALPLPRRFGQDCIDLDRLQGLAAAVRRDDTGWLAGAGPPRVDSGGLTLPTSPPRLDGEAIHAAPTDALAAAIRTVTVTPGDEHGPRVRLDVDHEALARAVLVLSAAPHALGRVLAGLGPGRTLHLQTAQRLGHTVRMLRLHEVWTARGAASLSFIVPSPANVTLCGPALADGSALLWRQLVEPGYGPMATPIDPLDEAYSASVALAVAANRHLLALVTAALAAGTNVVWVNDARHEGPLLFRAAIDWLARVAAPGRLHVVQLGYLALDPPSALPDALAAAGRQAAEAMDRLARDRGHHGPLPDGLQLARHHLLAQAQLAGRCASIDAGAIATTLYMTSHPAGALTTAHLDPHARSWLARHPPRVIPEIAAGPALPHAAAERRVLRRVAMSVGLSGHPELPAVLAGARAAARAHPDLHITMAGRGTDEPGPCPPNLVLSGVLPPGEHDRLLAEADVVVLKTTRNTRAHLLAARARRQGVLLFTRPLVAPASGEAFELCYLSETLREHLGDTAVTRRWLTLLGAADPRAHELDLGAPLVPQARAALAAWPDEAAPALVLGSPEDLAAYILDATRTQLP